MNDRLIVALDVDDVGHTFRIVDTLGDLVSFYKIGHRLGTRTDIRRLTKTLIECGNRVFIDYKLFDIPSTVGYAIKGIADMGATFTTVMAEPDTLKAAVQASGGTDLKILAVKRLTSDSMGVGIRDLDEIYEIGAHGVIISGRNVYRKCSILQVCPGIRMPGDPAYDQHATITPRQAVYGGADYLVVGRPITESPDMRIAVHYILDDMRAAR